MYRGGGLRYQRPTDPALSSNILLVFLLSQEKSGCRCVYRAQLREWSGPLLPSLYRRSIRRNRVLTEQDADFHELPLRRCGNAFEEMQPDSAIARIVSEAGSAAINLETYRGLIDLARDMEFSRDVCKLGHDRAFLGRLHPDQHESAKARLPIWRRVVDEIHRADIRQWGCLQAYGYVLGITLAQQYGFTSELLDFTSKPEWQSFSQPIQIRTTCSYRSRESCR